MIRLNKYEYVYRREQRHYFDILAETEEKSDIEAAKRINLLRLESEDDHSDDKGELELLNTVSCTDQVLHEIMDFIDNKLCGVANSSDGKLALQKLVDSIKKRLSRYERDVP